MLSNFRRITNWRIQIGILSENSLLICNLSAYHSDQYDILRFTLKEMNTDTDLHIPMFIVDDYMIF